MNRERKAWLVLWATYLASVVITINQFKVSAVMNLLMKELNITMVQGGWLVSFFSVAGILLALPAAYGNSKLGPKKMGMIALGCTALGSAIGTVSTNFKVLLVSRIIEGVGVGLIAVVAPAIIAMWFPPDKRGLPMGIWASWVPVGNFLIFNLASPISSYLGWHGVWCFGTFTTVVALAFYGYVVTSPSHEDRDLKENLNKENTAFSFIDGLKKPLPWVLGLAFAGIGGFAGLGYSSFAPGYFIEVHGVTSEKANFYTSLIAVMSIFSTVVAGWVIVKTKKTKLLMVISAMLTTLLYGFAFALPSKAWIVPIMLLMGFVQGFFATANFTLAPETVPSAALSGVALAVNNLLFNAGALMGPPIIGCFIGNGNWSAGRYPILVIMIFTVILSIVLSKMLGRKTLLVK